VIITLAKQRGITERRVAELLSWNASDFFNLNRDETMVTYEIEYRKDCAEYNHGEIINPWQGSNMWFPII